MEIKREIMTALVEWKQRPKRKPLIIQGTRQTGKTRIMRKFGEEHFEHVAYFKFEASEVLCQEFLRGSTLISYSCGWRIALARQLISGRQSGISADVSRYLPRVSMRHPAKVRIRGESFGNHTAVGNRYGTRRRSLLPLSSLRRHAGYRSGHTRKTRSAGGRGDSAGHSYGLLAGLDFAKHAPAKDIPRIATIWNSIPLQLARKNHKFVYKLVKTGARAELALRYSKNDLKRDGTILNIPLSLADWTEQLLKVASNK